MAAAIRASDFVSNIGINTHMAYTDGRYSISANVLADIQYLGLNLIRDIAPNYSSTTIASKYQLGAYNKMADAGIRFDFLSGRDRMTVVSDIERFAVAHAGAVVSIEGPNEINNAPVSYLGLTGTAAATAFMKDLIQKAGASDALKDIDILGLTGATPTTEAAINTGADFSNVHLYPAYGNQPGKMLATWQSVGAAKPVVITEAGYYTAPVNSYGKIATPSAWGGVDQLTQAKLTLNLLMDASKFGYEKIYLYQLLDAYVDPTGMGVDKNIGLFDYDNKPKLAATAIHNLTSILSDAGSAADTFKISDLVYTVKNLPPEGSTLTMQKSSGVTDIVLWSEPDIWDHLTYQGIAAPIVNSTVDFGSNHVSVKVYDPLISDKVIATYLDVTSVTVGVQDHPVIVEVTDIPDPILKGTSGDDTLKGTTLADHLVAGAGNDTVFGDAGDDVIEGGNGRNTIDGGDGFDMVSYADAATAITVRLGTPGFQKIETSTTDKLISIEGVIGSAFNDSLYGTMDKQSFFGGAGDDRFVFSGGGDLIDGGDGSDTLIFGPSWANGVTVSLQSMARQNVDANTSVQLVSIEKIIGTAYGDVLTAGASGSELQGGAGDDILISNIGNDILQGDLGADTASYELADKGVTVSMAIAGAQDTKGGGFDTLVGLQNLNGSAYGDNLTGSSAANIIVAGAGNDIIIGGGGADSLSGGIGADRFVYLLTSDSKVGAYDTINDFSSAQGDKIDLTRIDANTKLAGDNAFALVSSFTKHAGELMVTAETGGWLVQADVDGNGVSDFGLHVRSTAALMASDFAM